MKDKIAESLSKITSLSKNEVLNLIEVPPNKNLGDYAFPCFQLAKIMKKNPVEIAKDLSQQLKSIKEIEKIIAVGPYVNFFLNPIVLAENTIKKILKEKNNYGSQKIEKNKKILIEMSSPNIAKPFGIGHLRSTIIGNAVSNICSFMGYKTIKINYLGDWGTPFGKILLGYEKFGSGKKLKQDPIKYLYELYVRISSDESLENEARERFKKLEDGDKKAVSLWKKFRALSMKDFNKIYTLLGIKFDIISGESSYNKKIDSIVLELEKNNLLEESEGAKIINLKKDDLGVALIKKSDGATLYITRDIAAALDRHSKYKFTRMFYEVGSEQKLHFKQLFRILELLGYSWAKDCTHIDHGMYLDKDGKKFSTRKGKTVFMEDIINETIDLAKAEIQKREKLSGKDLEKRAKAIALAAIIYGDLKNYRSNDIIFDIERFLEFEGNTGPYLLYTYARAKSIIRKAKSQSKNPSIKEINEIEKSLIVKLAGFSEAISSAYNNLAPNLIANYAYELAQIFNEFYHKEKVIGSEKEPFRLAIVEATAQVLKNSLNILAIPQLEKM